MGAPASSMFSELHLQYLENTTTFNLLLDYDIKGYFRYVDNTLIVYNENTTNINELLNHFNNLSPKFNFTLEKEENHKINFLDVTITRDPNKLSVDIYRKPTYTDVIIPHDSRHPKAQKLAAIRYLYNRMNTYQSYPGNFEKEKNTVQLILHNNGYDISTLSNLHSRKKQKEEKEKVQWAKFTYTGKETTVITKAFKNTNIKAAFTTNNNVGKLLATNRHRTKCKYDNSGIYQITCPTCNKKYIGQTGRSYKIRFHEHFRDFKYRNNKSSFAQHLLENGHSIGPMEDIIEKFYIFREMKINNQINDKLTIQPNIIFDTIVQLDPYRGLPNACSTHIQQNTQFTSVATLH
jgi:hypothetical protein